MALIKPASIPHYAKIKFTWENSYISSCVKDIRRLHFEIETSAAASIPMEVGAFPERRSWPVSQKYLERELRLDLSICRDYSGGIERGGGVQIVWRETACLAMGSNMYGGSHKQEDAGSPFSWFTPLCLVYISLHYAIGDVETAKSWPIYEIQRR